jgi:uncharacterized damage-inducible protein DinB
MVDLRYPIGKLKIENEVTPEQRSLFIAQIEEAPAKLRAAVEGFSNDQFNTPYRPDGWTVRQVVHHLPDSHLNAYVRFRLALTEDQPTIKPYHEDKWAELSDARTAPPDFSLDLIDSLHRRWVMLLRSLSPEDFARSFRHPELGNLTLNQTLTIYAWHGRHHVAQITSLSERMGWR